MEMIKMILFTNYAYFLQSEYSWKKQVNQKHAGNTDDQTVQGHRYQIPFDQDPFNADQSDRGASGDYIVNTDHVTYSPADGLHADNDNMRYL
jgi:hypothetical protein